MSKEKQKRFTEVRNYIENNPSCTFDNVAFVMYMVSGQEQQEAVRLAKELVVNAKI